MRVLAVALGLVVVSATGTDAKPQRRAAKQHRNVKKTPKRVVVHDSAKPKKEVAAVAREPHPEDPYADDRGDDRNSDDDRDDRVEFREDHDEREERQQEIERPRTERPARRGAQSFGLPWSGELHDATRLSVPERVVIRRPKRAFGTRTTVEHIRQAIEDTLDAFPRTHVLAIGDLSSEHGGGQSDHHSHQNGRDADIGFFYKRKPANYPSEFVPATEANLDCAATFGLIANLAKTQGEDGGVQVMYLDYNVQGILYRWAVEHGVSEAKLDRLFEYPHGKGSHAGLIHHYRNHHHHVHVRFRCAKADTECQ